MAHGVGREVVGVAAGVPDTPPTPETDNIETKNDVETLSQAQSAPTLERTASRESYNQQIGVTKIETLYVVFGRGWKLVLLWASIALIAYVWSLAAITTSIYGAFATSYFGKHTIVGTIAVLTNLSAAITLPLLAKLCDVFSRPASLSLATFIFIIGYLLVAVAQNVQTVVAGETLYSAGRTGIYQIMHILISDMTPLQWRGLVLGAYSLGFLLNGFLAGFIASGIALSMGTGDGWRWGFGMFCIIIPVSICPSIAIMFWGHAKAKALGALSLASSSYARRRVLEGEHAAPKRTAWETTVYIFHAVDAVGLALFGFSFALLLSPPTLEKVVKNGYKNPALITMYAIGGALFIAFCIWEWKFARYPICPRRLLNRTFVACLFVDTLHFFSNYITDAYYNSWVYIVKPPWSDRNYAFFSNTYSTSMVVFAVITGLAMRFTHKYRYIQLFGIVVRCIGEGLNFMTASPSHQGDGNFVAAKIIIGAGAGIVVCTTAVGAPASVPHADLAIAMSILHMVAQLGGSVAGAISATVWNTNVPRNLKKYLPNTDQATRDKIFGNIRLARRTKPHDMVVRAYSEAIRPLLIIAICTSVLAFFISLFGKEIYLDKSHNDVERHKIIEIKKTSETTDAIIEQKVKEAEERAAAQLQEKGR
ncbi:hypothetical protein Q8F55_005388 [Vanrija albida]|uniref:Major facilitator superfamily (MFS) profile domain-containing protein n=1 Tax=Vanrija albida TaxID=181172 RepID=A0ABR3Q1Q8_9TREE